MGRTFCTSSVVCGVFVSFRADITSTQWRHTMSNIAHLDTAALDTAAKFFRTMQKAGADFTGPLQSTAQRRNLVAYLEMGCPKVDGNGTVVTPQLPDGTDLCRLILGDDFLSPEDVARVYGFSYSDEQVANLSEALPDFETLMCLRSNSYMLVATPPTDHNLLQVRDLGNQLFYSKSEGWYAEDNQKFSRSDSVKAEMWLAIRKESYPDSRGKTWDEQTALLSDNEHVPNAAEVSYAVTAYYKVRGIYLLRGVYVRTSSVSADGYRVFVGDFGEDGLYVNHYWFGYRYGYIGVSSSLN